MELLWRTTTWVAVTAALGAGFVVGKATDTVFSGDQRLTAEAGDAPAEEPTKVAEPVPEKEPPTTGPAADTTPPELSVAGPAEGEHVGERTVRFEGTTEPGAAVAVGPWGATVAEDGTWHLVLKLSPGANPVTVTAKDAAGNVATVTVTVHYDAPAPPPKPPAEPAPEKPDGCVATYEGCEHKEACPATTGGCERQGDPPACPSTSEGCEKDEKAEPPACVTTEGACIPETPEAPLDEVLPEG